MEPRVVISSAGTFHIVEGRSTIIRVFYNRKKAEWWLDGYKTCKANMKGDDNGNY